METWSKWTEFFACGLLVLPLTLGFGMDSFDIFAFTLAPMLLILIGFTLGAPTVPPPENESGEQPPE